MATKSASLLIPAVIVAAMTAIALFWRKQHRASKLSSAASDSVSTSTVPNTAPEPDDISKPVAGAESVVDAFNG